MSSPEQLRIPDPSLLSTRLAATHLTQPYLLYQWKPLADPSNHIRILIIIPSVETSEIRCSLEVKPLVEDPPPLQRYRALSYVWGDPNDKLPITIIEDHSLYTAYVTKNLVAAITDLRRPENAGSPNIATPPPDRSPNAANDPLHLWVDAVCIDQSNDDERSAQIQIMSDIYSRSCGVVVWLPPTPMMAAHPLDLTNFRPADGWYLGNGPWWINHSDSSTALAAFFYSPWWSRAWVIQEVI